MKRILAKHRRLFALLVVAAMLLSVLRPEAMRWVSASQVTAEEETRNEADASVIDPTNNEADASGTRSETVTESTADAEDTAQDTGAKTLSVRVPESGCTITIQAPEGSLPYPADELAVTARELQPGSDEYNEYYNASMEALDLEVSESVSFARFFDIQILRNGQEIEPESPVEVKIEYDKKEAPEVSEGAELSVVHFAEEGTEVIENVDVSDDATEIVYEQGSFSVVATIVTEPAPSAEGTLYAVVAKHDGKVFIVQGDGTLTEVVNYDEEGDKITKVYTNNPMLWSYFIDAEGSYLRYSTEGYDFDWSNQATTFAKAYIDPISQNGVTYEVPEKNPDGTVKKVEGKTVFVSPKDHASITLDDWKHIYHLEGADDYSFIAVGPNGRIVGGLSPFDLDQLDIINGTEFYLAKVSDDLAVTDKMPYYHMVNHIDISISDTVSTKLHLAYGTYYDKDGNQILTIDRTTPEEDQYTTVLEDVSVGQEHLRNAKIETFCNGAPIDNVYYITGYTANAPSGFSDSQVRIEGGFKVANLPTADLGHYTSNTAEIKAARLKPENQIRYKVTAVEPDVEFYYRNPKNPTEYLYDSMGKKISVSGTVTISAEFGYWDADNKCPPLQASWSQVDHDNWTQGGILTQGTSGMDFILDGDSHVDLDPVALEITKTIVDKDGNTIHPSEDLNNLKFDVYQDTGASSDAVKDLDVGSFTTPADYTGYIKTHSDLMNVDHTKGTTIVNDHNADQGMIYIVEDKDSIPDQFTGQDGKIWVYKNTYIKTEYVWREQGDESKRSLGHISPTYTKDDATFASIPEILGNYGEPDSEGNRLFNGFLEFDVYNVYEEAEKPSKKETVPYDGTGVLGGVKVGDIITYEISYKNYKTADTDVVISDQLDANVEFIAADNNGVYSDTDHKVNWTLSGVKAGASGKVTLQVKVLPSALDSNGGPGKVVNGGDTATVKIGVDPEYTLEEVENPVPEVPEKQETAPYTGTGVLGAVKVGDEITYTISYKNYKSDVADIIIKDKLDPNVEFVVNNDGSVYDADNRTVTWTIRNVAAGSEGTVSLTVKVLEGALQSKRGPGKVVNGGDNTTVKVGNDNEYSLNEVENPVPENPEKKEKTPYEGTGLLGAVKVGDEITYEISYKNYKTEAANVVITDTLDPNVQFVSASDDGAEASGVVTWTITGVAAGCEWW